MKKNFVQGIIGIFLLCLISPGYINLKANGDCRVDTIILNKKVYYVHDTIVMEIKYCGPACGCPEITQLTFKAGFDYNSDSLEHQPFINRENNSILRPGIAIGVYDRWGTYHLVLNNVAFPDTRIAIIPSATFELKSENINGCANGAGRLFISTQNSYYDSQNREWLQNRYDSLNVEWLQNDSIIKTSKFGDLQFPKWSESNKGSYRCVLKVGDIPFDTTNVVTLGFYNTQKAAKPVGETSLCYMSKSVLYQIEGKDNTSYQWTVSPTEAAIFSSDSSEVLINWASQFSGKAKINIREINGFCYGEYSDTLEVSVAERTDPPSFLYVSVNNSVNHNEVIWDYEVTPAILTFGVYRETSVSNQFSLIGTVLPGQDLRFTDTKSTPQEQYYRYRVSAFDTCGYESVPSVIQKTIHLTVNAGLNHTWNLIWDGYEGIDFSTYRILRGSTNNELTLLAEVASTRSLFTDLHPLENTAWYQIEIVVDPSGKKSTSSAINIRSNIESTKNTSISSELAKKQVQIQVNYNSKSISVINIENPFNMEIYSITGSLIKTYQLVSPNQSIDLSELAKGLYLMRINDGKERYMKKFTL